MHDRELMERQMEPRAESQNLQVFLEHARRSERYNSVPTDRDAGMQQLFYLASKLRGALCIVSGSASDSTYG